MSILKCSKIIWKENIERPFVSISSFIFDYIELGLISGNDLKIYAKLIDMHNPDIGYAYPTWDQLEVMTNLSRDTIGNSLKNLVDLGLIEIGKGFKGNNVYIVYKPLKTDELYSLLPDRVQVLKQKIVDKNIKGESDKQRLREWKQSIQEEQVKEINAKRITPKNENNDSDSLPPEDW